MQRGSKTKDILTNKSPKVVSWQEVTVGQELDFLPLCPITHPLTKVWPLLLPQAFAGVFFSAVWVPFFQVCTALFTELWASIKGEYVRTVREPKSNCFLEQLSHFKRSKNATFRSFPYSTCNFNAACFFYLFIWSFWVCWFPSFNALQHKEGSRYPLVA